MLLVPSRDLLNRFRFVVDYSNLDEKSTIGVPLSHAVEQRQDMMTQTLDEGIEDSQTVMTTEQSRAPRLMTYSFSWQRKSVREGSLRYEL